jgi:hypothetical protein
LALVIAGRRTSDEGALGEAVYVNEAEKLVIQLAKLSRTTLTGPVRPSRSLTEAQR